MIYKVINVDTNILVRVFLQDNVEQAKLAQDILIKAAQAEKLFISSYSILEFAWVLKAKKFTRE